VISKKKIKLIKSLEYKKYREINQLFIAEGNKIVKELLRSNLIIKTLIGTSDYLQEIKTLINSGIEIIEATDIDIKSVSLLKNPQEAIALCQIPFYNIEEANPTEKLIICLDNIQDPGNMGTIIRIADWFGIENVVCSLSTADIFNPKSVQASMGSVCRVKVHYTELPSFLKSSSEKTDFIAGAFIEGDNIYTTDLPKSGILVMGNEGRGISDEVIPFINQKISIPSFSVSANHAESLNAAIATAIFCSEFRRREISGNYSK
jgi:RNA methyltransferase, TrmH family